MAATFAPRATRTNGIGAPRDCEAGIASESARRLPNERPFLRANWCDFLMLSYEVDPRVLTPYVPRGTELDAWHGATYLSIVGFTFARAQLFGVRIPFHQNFEEVNLRFYVRRRIEGAWRRGIVFIRELAAKRAVALVARAVYGERFLRVPMRRRIERAFQNAAPHHIEYAWNYRGRENCLAAHPIGPPHPPAPESLEEFVVEHYWAYTASRRGDAVEYFVAREPWQIAIARDAKFDCDARVQYGEELGSCLVGQPVNAFWADGSAVRVYPGKRLRDCPTAKRPLAATR